MLSFARASSVATSASTRAFATLVTTKWLNDNLKNTKVLDGSWYLPFQKRNPQEEFLQSRIPGAQFFGIDDICDKNTDLPHMLPSPEEFSKAIGALGIKNKDHVVVYDTKGIFSVCRVYWTFKAFGHEKVSILSGGFPDWVEAGYPLASGPAEPVEPVPYQATLNRKLVRTYDQILENIKSFQETGKGENVVDARTEGRFLGRDPEPRPIPSGNIPFSSNLPFQLVLDTQGRHFLPPDQLAALFNSRGIDITKPSILTCGSGATAAILYVALELCGNTQLSLYDGSWTEYATKRLAHPDQNE